MQQESPLNNAGLGRGAECSGRQLLFLFWRSIVKMTDITQGLGKPVSLAAFCQKKKTKWTLLSFFFAMMAVSGL